MDVIRYTHTSAHIFVFEHLQKLSQSDNIVVSACVHALRATVSIVIVSIIADLFIRERYHLFAACPVRLIGISIQWATRA